MEFEELKRVRTLHQATFVYLIPGLIGIAHFRVRYDRWIEEVKTYFLQPWPPSEVIYSQIPSRKRHVYYITLSIVYIQISNTYLPEFLNILLYVEANPVRMCR